MEYLKIYPLGLFPSLIMTIAIFRNDIRYDFDGNWKRRLLFVALCLGSFVSVLVMDFILVYVSACRIIERHNRKKCEGCNHHCLITKK